MLERLKELALWGVDKNSGEKIVKEHLRNNPLEGEIFLFSVGKAAYSTIRGAMEVLGKRVKKAMAVGLGKERIKGVETHQGSHPYPDRKSLRAGEAALKFAQERREGEKVIFLLSGGASSLMVYPHPPFTLEDLQDIYRKLILSGASIGEINTVRRHISAIKGGRLAQAFYPAEVLTLALSDVRFDVAEDIGSGPTVGDRTTKEDAEEVLRNYGLFNYIPKLREVPETPKPWEPVFKRSSFLVLANTLKVLRDIKEKAEAQGIRTFILTGEDAGEAKEVAKIYAGIMAEVLRSSNPVSPPVLLLSGGELTVTVRGKGKGGRNTEFVLSLLMETASLKGKFCALSMGTDGIDGPTDAAGAFFCQDVFEKAMALKPKAYLENNDSYRFFEKLGLLLKTGPTDTNLRDIRLFWIEKS